MTTRADWTAGGEADTPYARARQEWDTRMGTTLVQAKNWRLATFASLAVASLATIGMGVLGAQPKAVPHIIEVDRLGEAIYRGPVGQAAYTPSDAVIIYHLRRFIEDTREISSDIAVLRRAWLDAYEMVTPREGRMLAAFVQAPETDPFHRAQETRVTVELRSAVRVSADTWQVDWRESTFDKNGALVGEPVEWRAMLKTVVEPPKTPEAMSRNPLGLFVDELHWDKVSGGAGGAR